MISNITNEFSALLSIASRDVLKLIRDKTRILASLIFPVVFIGALGGSLQSNWGDDTGYNLLIFVFTGVFGQTLFQSTASGLISLVEDRVNDFSQEMFVAPISRYTIILGKIIGETIVSFLQGIAILVFGLLIGVEMNLVQVLMWIPAAFAMCIFGGAFGIMILSNLSSERTANQIFPFIIFPQFFLAGIFSPIKDLPWFLYILSRIAPMTYAVDLGRGVFYAGTPEYSKVVLHSPLFNLTVMAGYGLLFLVVGTWLFVRNERNK